MACDTVYSVKLIYKESWKSMEGIDPDMYSLIVLKSDFTELLFGDAEAWKNMEISFRFEAPGERLVELGTEDSVQEMFKLCKGQSLIVIHCYVKGDGENVDTQPSVNVGKNRNRKKRIRKRKTVTKEELRVRRKTPTGLGLTGAANTKQFENMVQSDDDEDDEDFDAEQEEEHVTDQVEEFYNKYTEDGSEMDTDDASDMENDTDREFENESDNEGIYHPLRKCLNRAQFETGEDEKITLKKGMIFATQKDLKAALIDYTIQEGCSVTYVRSEPGRITVACTDKNCGWWMHSSLLPDEVTFGIKVLNDIHTCRLDGYVIAPLDWIAKKIVSLVKADREVSRKVLEEKLLKYGLKPKRHQLIRAKRRALEMIDGNHGDSFRMLPRYCLEVMKSNPGSLAKIEYCMLPNQTIPSVKRMFLGFDATKQGFLEGCRPYLGLDGCHLKGFYGGVLLSAIANDPDGGFFSVAVAYVEGESKDSWNFFLNMLKDFLGGFGEDREWTFMTDRQKGLSDVIVEVVPHANERKCARHIYANFRKQHPGIAFKKLFWNASMAYNETDFNIAMKGIKDLSVEAYKYLVEVGDSSLWARHSFSKSLKCPNVTNNPVESFNNWLGALRNLPVSTMLDQFRCKVMCRLSTRFQKCLGWTGEVCPRTDETIRIVTKQSRRLTIFQSNLSTYEVEDGNAHYVVRLENKSCDCGVWDHTGVPCKHAAAVLMHRRYPLAEYCDNMLSQTQFQKAYSFMITPVPDKSLWPDSQLPPCNPPELKRRIGRPKTKSIKEDWEGEDDMKRSTTHKCSKCKQFGHNILTCAGGLTAKEKKKKEAEEKKKKMAEEKMKVVEMRSKAAQLDDQLGNEATTLMNKKPARRTRKRKVTEGVLLNDHAIPEPEAENNEAEPPQPDQIFRKNREKLPTTRRKKRKCTEYTRPLLDLTLDKCPFESLKEPNPSTVMDFPKTTADKEVEIMEDQFESTTEPISSNCDSTFLDFSQTNDLPLWENNQFDCPDLEFDFDKLQVTCTKKKNREFGDGSDVEHTVNGKAP